ncbi:MAG: MucBP domain-containing protein [Bacilli bacterium]|nr:MucBP domain-containing protein [Bacilli bacterium]
MKKLKYSLFLIVGALFLVGGAAGLIMATRSSYAAGETIKNSKTARWTNDSKTKADIDIVYQADSNGVLLLGSLCHFHGLTKETLLEEINNAAQRSDVTYYLEGRSSYGDLTNSAGNPFYLKDDGVWYRLVQQRAHGVVPKNSTITWNDLRSDDGEKLLFGKDSTTLGYNATSQGAHANAETYAKDLLRELMPVGDTWGDPVTGIDTIEGLGHKYDMIILSYDSLVTFAQSADIYNQRLMRKVAGLLKPYYDENKVIWITPTGENVISTEIASNYQDNKYHADSPINLLTDNNSNNYPKDKATYDADPWYYYRGAYNAWDNGYTESGVLTKNDIPKWHVPHNMVQMWGLLDPNTYQSVTNFLGHLSRVPDWSEWNQDVPKTSYVNAEDVRNLIGQTTRYDSYVIRDTVNEGLVPTDIDVYYYDDNDWVKLTSGYTQNTDQDLLDANIVEVQITKSETIGKPIKLVIHCDCPSGFDTNKSARDTNVGEATVETYEGVVKKQTTTYPSPTLLKLFKVETEVEHGTITESDLTVSGGTNKVINYSPDTGYQLKSITVDGTPVSITSYQNEYTFPDISADHHIKVVYEPKSVNYSVRYLEKGSGTQLHNPKTGTDNVYGDVIYSSNEKIKISNYHFVEADRESMTLAEDAEDNVMTLYYQKNIPDDVVKKNQVTKTSSTESIKKTTDIVSYQIKYEVNLEDYEGQANIVVTDVLQYGIDEQGSSLDGGTYNSSSKTITWTESKDVTENTGNITITKNIRLKYVDYEFDVDTVHNVAIGHTTLVQLDNYEFEDDDEVDIPQEIGKVKVTVHHVDGGGTKLVDDEVTKYDPGSNYYTNPAQSLVDTGYSVTIPGNANGTLGEDDVEVTYIYTRPPVVPDQPPVKSVDKQKAYVGDELTYTITQVVPEQDRMNYYTTWAIEDRIPTGTEFVIGSVKVKRGNTDVTSKFHESMRNYVLKIEAKEDELARPDFYDNTYEIKFKVRVTQSRDVIENQATLNNGSTTLTSNKVQTEIVHKITTEVENGTISADKTDIESGSTETIFYTPDLNCVLKSIEVNGEAVSIEENQDQYEFINIHKDYHIKVVYEKKEGPDVIEENDVTKEAEVKEIKDKNDLIDYNINYNVGLNGYEGTAIVSLVDYLPYEIDVDASKLDGGTYSKKDKTITWREEITVDKDDDSITLDKNIKIRYKNYDMTKSKIKNTAIGKTKLVDLDNYEIEDMDEEEVNNKIPIKITVHHVDKKGKKLAPDEIVTVYPGDSYKTYAATKLVKDGYTVEVPDNYEGIAKGDLDVTYIYNKEETPNTSTRNMYLYIIIMLLSIPCFIMGFVKYKKLKRN